MNCADCLYYDCCNDRDAPDINMDECFVLDDE